MIASSFVYINSESVNDAISSTVETRNTNETPLVGLAEEEFWPVLRVSFPAKPFPNSQLGDLFEGNNSAQQYISEMSGGDSQLTTTIVGETWPSPYLESHWGTDSETERDTGADSGGARELAREAIISTFQDQDISQWDLDGCLSDAHLMPHELQFSMPNFEKFWWSTTLLPGTLNASKIAYSCISVGSFSSLSFNHSNMALSSGIKGKETPL